jgi:peptide/nickel transport system permease protein
MVGLAIVLAIVLTVACAPVLAPYSPTQSSVFFLAPPDAAHWMGTDDLGRDTFSRLLYGGRSSLIVGIGAAVIATVLGVPVGLSAG